MTTFVSDGSLSARAHHRETVDFATQQSGPTVGLFDLWAVVKRRIWFLAAIIIGCTSLSAVASFTLPKSYTASSEVVLERKDVRPFATDAALTSIDRDRSAAETEMDVLQSRKFAGRIVDRLNLIDDPSFNPYAPGGEKASGAGNGPLEYIRNILGIRRSPTADRVIPDVKAQRDHAISALLSQFEVSRTGESLAVRLVVVNQNPRLAQQIANTIATLYVEASLEFKQDERVADKERALNTGGAVAFLRQSMTQPLLITLRNEEARLLQSKAELAAKYGKNHPQMVDADSQIAGIRSMIEDEVQRILSDLEAESLKPSARIVSTAELPNSPSFPKPGLIIPAAFAGSTLLACVLALLLETMDTRVRSGQRTAQLLRVPNLGYIPRIPKHLTFPGAKRSSCIPDWSNFTSAEAERAVYMAGRYSDAKQLRRTVMVTSCVHDIANASTAWGIATAAAADGRPTAFVNLDFNRHNVPYLRSLERSPEPIERYLRNQAVIGEIVQSVPTLPGFGFIDATHVMTEPFRSLDSDKLCELIMDLKQSGYDFIVLHAPPVLASGDATWLAPFVDGVILMANWGKTTEEQLQESAAQLRMNHAHLIGTVINQVNPEIHRRHHYGGFVITSKRIPAGGWHRIRGNGAFPERADAEINPLPAPAARASITRPSNVA
ncbi:chain-length determining protein [Sinorhizobium meliloti]|nr:chain-length determining protein [Sinorhizobium meliloti]MDW9544135.1 chain-length determining protein [Sinorhizobium meliloti]MDW9799707.1 chain-length determining protein [Sinorhizobium meliloti]MDX0200406.1 chain-length determining protein [Sinorhizobium meliloti]MDX0235815.1 chain-length determining protein [Sinorhizobium meliloti]